MVEQELIDYNIKELQMYMSMDLHMKGYEEVNELIRMSLFVLQEAADENQLDLIDDLFYTQCKQAVEENEPFTGQIIPKR